MHTLKVLDKIKFSVFTELSNYLWIIVITAKNEICCDFKTSRKLKFWSHKFITTGLNFKLNLKFIALETVLSHWQSYLNWKKSN